MALLAVMAPVDLNSFNLLQVAQNIMVDNESSIENDEGSQDNLSCLKVKTKTVGGNIDSSVSEEEMELDSKSNL